VTFDSAANMVAPLATNQLEAGGGAPSAGLFNALRSGVNVRIVADKGHSDPTPPGFPVSIYLVRKELVDSGRVRGVADLKGLRFAQPARGISPEVDLVLLLKEGGLTPADLDTTIMSFPDQVPAFANGSLDFSFSVEPFATIALNQGTVSVLKYDYEFNPYHQVAVLLYSPDFSRSDLGTKFMTAYLRGVRVYNDAFVKREPTARERAISALVQHTPVKNRALYDQMTLSALHPDGKMHLQSFEVQQEHFLSTGAQQGRVDVAQFIDLQHIEAAAAALGPYR
jgi:NitT/TauT family transport system substrate-binding protein